MVSSASAGRWPGTSAPSSERKRTSSPPAGGRTTPSSARGSCAAFGAVRRTAFGLGTTLGFARAFGFGAPFFLAAISSRQQQAPWLLEVLLHDVHPART